MKRKKIEGYITVYLTMMLGIMIVVITTVIAGARRQTIRFQTECVMDAGLNSIFAEYHREALRRYGLLFIDDSYGREGSVDNTKAHFLRYMNMNFEANSGLGALGTDITSLQADNAFLDKVSFASDDNGTVLRYQIIQYMKTKSGINLISGNEYNPVDLEDSLNEYDVYNEERNATEETIDEMMNDYNASLPEDAEPMNLSNPADSVEKLSLDGAMYYAFGDGESLSVKVVDTNQYISNRGYTDGYGLYDNQESPYGISNDIFYTSYVFEKLGYYNKKIDNSRLDYQIEYIVAGKDGDIENLEEIVNKIFMVRYSVNMGYLLSDAAKQQEALEMALAVTSAIGNPELVQPVKTSILLAWGYAESAKDLRILFDGHKLGAVKTAEDWNTPLSQIVDFKNHLSEYSFPVNGNMEYKDFLYGFLMITDKDKQNMRLMDIIEMDIRLTPGNGGFKMDNQIYQMEVLVNVSSRYGYGCSIKRGFSYR